MMFLFAFHFDASFLWLTKFLSPNLNWTQSSWFWIIILSQFDSFHIKSSIKSIFFRRLHQCWSRMSETKCIDGNFQMLVTVSVVSVWPLRHQQSTCHPHLYSQYRRETIAGKLTGKLCYAWLVEPFIHWNFQSLISYQNFMRLKLYATEPRYSSNDFKLTWNWLE